MVVNDVSVMHPVESVKVNNFLFRALLDTAGGRFHASLVLQRELNLHNVYTGTIKVMMYPTIRQIDVYKIEL